MIELQLHYYLPLGMKLSKTGCALMVAIEKKFIIRFTSKKIQS